MFKIISWFNETFPPKEFMLRSTGGIKLFKLGTTMQVILISLLIISGCLVALFTYKMQFLQTVNYKQNVALKDLRVRYAKFTNTVVSLRNELKDEKSNFSDTDLNVELQVKKVTKLLELLENDLALINQNVDIKNDHRLIKVKNRLENIINEKKNRENMILELDSVRDNLQINIDKIYKKSNDNFYIDSNFSSVFYNNEKFKKLHHIKYMSKFKNSNTFLNLEKTIEESIRATTELKMLSYNLAMQKEKKKYYANLNNSVKEMTLVVLDEKINFIEKIFSKTRSYDLAKLNKVKMEQEIGGPLEEQKEEDLVAYAIYDKSNKLEMLRNRFLSIPLAAPIQKYYITSGYGVRKDPYTKRKAFHKGIDLGAAWGSNILSTASGIITYVGRYGSYGNSVFIDHGYGIQTKYAHLSKILVKKGEKVDLGQIIGKIGNSGRSTGKHLHYEIKVNKKSRNPRPFLRIGKNVFKTL